MSVATMLIDIHMDGASPIGDLRRCGALLTTRWAWSSGSPGFAQKLPIHPDLLGNWRFCPKRFSSIAWTFAACRRPSEGRRKSFAGQSDGQPGDHVISLLRRERRHDEVLMLVDRKSVVKGKAVD